MRSAFAGPSNNAAKAKPSGVVAPSSPSSSPVVSPISQGLVKVYGTDADTFPLAQFENNSSVSHILHTLQLLSGGLKVKGGNDTFISDDSRLSAGEYVVIGSAGLRIRVVWKGNKLVVPYPFPNQQVIHLQDEIASRFSRFHTGESELKMAEIRTIDGYLISKYDRIMEAVHEGDVLEAIDFDSWQKEQAQLCKETWLAVSQSDFIDDVSKWAKIGKHNHGKLFVQTGHGNTVDRLELFELEDLKVFAKEGQHQILTNKGTKDNFVWETSASFTVSPAGNVTAVRLEVKSLSDPRPTIKEIAVSVEGKRLSKGEDKVIQVSDEEDYDESKPLPPSKSSDKQLVQPIPVPENIPMVTVQAFQRLKIEQVDPVFADQSWAQDGVFNNNFYLNFSFSNPSETVVTVAKVKTEYEVSEGNWVAAKTAIGYKNGFYDYRWNWNNNNFRLDKHAIETIAILCSIPVKAPQSDRQRRAHSSLPNPLKIRTTFEDDQGAVSYIDLVNYNKQYSLPTKESIEKYNSKEYVSWVQLDDIEAETRHYANIALTKENEDREYLELRSSLQSSTYYFYKNDLRKLAFDAVKNGVTEIEMESLKGTSAGAEAHAYALVDTEKKSVYAIKWVLSTPSSVAEEYYRVKPLKFK